MAARLPFAFLDPGEKAFSPYPHVAGDLEGGHAGQLVGEIVHWDAQEGGDSSEGGEA